MANIFIGTKSLSDAYFGGTGLDSIWFGEVKLWSKSTPTEWEDPVYTAATKDLSFTQVYQVVQSGTDISFDVES